MSFEFVTGTEFILANDAVAIFVTNTDVLRPPPESRSMKTP
jgi:hypothetical protein